MTRFAREIEMGRAIWYMATIIIVDRIGRGSNIQQLAQEVGGDIVQMSMGYWPQEVAQILEDKIEGYEHPLATMDRSEIHDYLQEAMKTVPLADYLS